MGRTRKKPEGESLNLNFQADADLVRRIEAEVDRIEEDTGFKPSRSKVVIRLLEEALDARAAKSRPK